MEKHVFLCFLQPNVSHFIHSLMLAGSQCCHCLIVQKTGNYTADLTQNLTFLMSICTVFFKFVLQASASLKCHPQRSILVLSSFIVLSCVHSPFYHAPFSRKSPQVHFLNPHYFLQAYAEF